MDELQARLADLSERQNRYLQILAIRELEVRSIASRSIRFRPAMNGRHLRQGGRQAGSVRTEGKPVKRPSVALQAWVLAAALGTAGLVPGRSWPGEGPADDPRLGRPTGGRQHRSAEGRRQQQGDGRYRRFLDLMRRRGAARGGPAPARGFEPRKFRVGTHRARIGDERGLRATEAIHLYAALLKAYPNYARNDAVLYNWHAPTN